MNKKPSQSLAVQLKPFVAPFRIDGTGEFHLKSHATAQKGGIDKEKGEKILDANRKRLSDFQEKLYAQDRWSLLLIFQAMDAAGKDSAIKSVFDGVNPQGCEVTSFKQPSTDELDHDFMWRSASRCRSAAASASSTAPITRSAWWCACIRKSSPRRNCRPKLVTKNIWRERFEDISAFERYLARNGTVILKFFLNVSKEEQRGAFSIGSTAGEELEILDGRHQRARAVGQIPGGLSGDIRHTSTAAAPWYVVPADHKWFARVVIGSAIVSALERLDLKFPDVDAAALEEFKQVRKALENEDRKPAVVAKAKFHASARARPIDGGGGADAN